MHIGALVKKVARLNALERSVIRNRSMSRTLNLRKHRRNN